MPRDGSSIYTRPPGTDGVPDTTIESNKYNGFVADVETDLNIPRPVIAGGTGATNPHDAMVNLKGEMTFQVVNNYDTFPFVPGSFYSTITATASPVNGHGFVGICYAADNLNMVLEARDETTTGNPGLIYIREKKSGVWGAWVGESAALDITKVNRAGDTMTGALLMGPNTGIGLHDTNAPITFGTGGHKIERHTDGRLMIGGGALDVEVLTSKLKLSGPPVDPLHAATKGYADAVDTAKVAKAGDTMTGFLTLHAPPTADLHAATKAYADSAGVAGGADKLPKAGGTMTGTLITAPSIVNIPQITPSPAFVVQGGPGGGDDSFISFARGASGVNFGLGADNKMKVGGWGMGALAYELCYNDQESQLILGGANVTPKNLGNLGGATVVIDPGKRPLQSLVNTGAGTITPATGPGLGGQCTLYVSNSSGAVIPLTSGWSFVDGAFDATVGSKFVCSCVIFPSAISVLTILKVA